MKIRTAKRVTKKTSAITDGGTIESVTDAVTYASKFNSPRFGFLVSRGQKDFSWHLQPGIFRRDRWHRYERHMIRELIATHPQEFATDRTMFEKLVRMQHFGLPSRLLDVSSNFLVSLFFASEPTGDKADGSIYLIRGTNGLRKYFDSDAVSVLSNLSNLSAVEKRAIRDRSPDNGKPVPDAFNSFEPVDRLLHFIRDEKPYFRPIIDKEDVYRTFYVIPKKSNPRIVAQSGAFLIFGLVSEPSRVPDLSEFKLTKFRIPASSKSLIRRNLAGLGITASSLYPEIDKAATQIAEFYYE